VLVTRARTHTRTHLQTQMPLRRRDPCETHTQTKHEKTKQHTQVPLRRCQPARIGPQDSARGLSAPPLPLLPAAAVPRQLPPHARSQEPPVYQYGVPSLLKTTTLLSNKRGISYIVCVSNKAATTRQQQQKQTPSSPEPPNSRPFVNAVSQAQ
jgi:hypothetical protein